MHWCVASVHLDAVYKKAESSRSLHRPDLQPQDDNHFTQSINQHEL
jgi:hypothetical protein